MIDTNVLVEASLPIEELLMTDAAETIRRRDDNSATILRTSLDDLGVEVLNLFPPSGHVFWSFGLFVAQDQAFRAAARNVMQKALKRVVDLQKRAGVDRKSINAYEFLGCFTRPQGDTYSPYLIGKTSVPYWWFAQRHINLMCSSEQYDGHLKYFERQIQEIGADCYRAVPDDQVLVNNSQYDELPDYRYLSTYVARLSTAERVEASDAMVKDEFLENADSSVLQLVGCREGPNIALLHDLAGFEDADRIRTILCQRVGLSIQFITLINLERMRNQLATEPFTWHSEDRTQMLAALDEKLAEYPVIETAVA